MTPAAVRDRLEASLSGAYTIERELGGGGMSRVFVAADQRLGRRIVVKVLAPDLLEGVSVERFEQEIRLAARLQHPNVVPVLAAGDSDGAPYYTMPFVTGESLRARLDHGTPGSGPSVPLPEALRILTDVMRALAYAHAEGVIHRDIKPDNVLLSGGVAVVTDFGIAKALQTARAGSEATTTGPATGALTRVGTALGTPAYMAPEQAVGEAVDGRADLYAWGMLAYETLVGAHPFAERTTTQQLLVAQLTERPAPLADRAPQLPPALTALVEQCLEKEPDARPATAADALARLEQVQLSGASATIAREPMPAAAAGASARRARRTRLLATLGVVGALALGGAGIAAWHARSAAPPLVAVLPFQTQGVADDSLFAGGLNDAVNQKLAGLSGLRVIDPGSVTSATGGATRGRSPQEVGRALGADYVLRTVVRWLGGSTGAHQVQISPSLVRVADGTTRWAGEPMVVAGGGDLFRAQSELATQVAEALGVALGAKDRARLERAPTTDSVAYAAYQRGREIGERGITEHSVPLIDAAIAEFAQATARDPKFADAYAHASTLLGTIYNAGGAGNPGVLLDSAEHLARRALAVDPANVMANSELAFVLNERGDLAGARRVMARAVAANPSNVDLLRAYAWDLHTIGDTAGSARAADQLVRLAPRSILTLQTVAALRAAVHRPDAEVDSLYARVLALDPGRTRTYLTLAWRAAARGDTAGVDRWVGEYRARGGRITASNLSLLRSGGATLRRELATVSPDAVGAATPSDRDDVYEARLQLLASTGADVRALADSSLALVTAQLREPGLPPTARYFLLRYVARLSAVRGDSTAATRALDQAATDPLVRSYPLGTTAAQQDCAAAETYGWLNDVPRMVPALRACLTVPGGMTTAFARGLPAIARHADQPEVRALLSAAPPHR